VRNGQRSGAEQIARAFHALADGTRLRVLLRLRDGEECVCNLTDALEAGQSRLSFHLKTLKDAGLVRDRRAGRWVYYALEPGALETLETFLRSLRVPAGTVPEGAGPIGDRVRSLRAPAGTVRRVAARCCP
jgi:ArsR family transcriptional regulator